MTFEPCFVAQSDNIIGVLSLFGEFHIITCIFGDMSRLVISGEILGPVVWYSKVLFGSLYTCIFCNVLGLVVVMD